MIKETWQKNALTIVVGCSPVCEWRYEFKDGAYWISGMSLFWLISNGWKQI